MCGASWRMILRDAGSCGACAGLGDGSVVDERQGENEHDRQRGGGEPERGGEPEEPGEEAAKQRADGDTSPAEQPVDAVHPTEDILGYDGLTKRDGDHVPDDPRQADEQERSPHHGGALGEGDHGEDYGADQYRRLERPARTEPEDYPVRHQASDDPAHRSRGEQHTVTEAPQDQDVLGEEDEDRLRRGERHVEHPEHDRQRAYQPVVPEPPQTLPDLDHERRRGSALGPLWPEPAPQREDEGGRRGESASVEQERNGDGHAEQETPERRTGQLVGDDLGTKEAAVGPLQMLP